MSSPLFQKVALLAKPAHKGLEVTLRKLIEFFETRQIQVVLSEAAVSYLPEKEVTDRQSLVISKKIRERTQGKPLAYIVGHKEFYGLDFIVNKNTLVLRPETEMLVDEALNLLSNMLSNTLVVDVGTGSGNIIISIATGKKSNTLSVSH